MAKKNPKQSIKEAFAEVKRKKQEYQDIMNFLNSTNFHTEYNGNRKASLQDVKRKGQQAARDVRNGHADWHEPWFEHDLPANAKNVLNNRRKKK